ncbi:MAG: hypothetical protein ACI94L_001223, partial [Flavobacteriaceae bacterium]
QVFAFFVVFISFNNAFSLRPFMDGMDYQWITFF